MVARIPPSMPPAQAPTTDAGNKKGKTPAPASSPPSSTDSQRLAPLIHVAKLNRNTCARTARRHSRTGALDHLSAVRPPPWGEPCFVLAYFFVCEKEGGVS